MIAGCATSPSRSDLPDSAEGVGHRLGILGASFERGYNQDDAHIADHPEVSWPNGNWPWSFAARSGASNVTNAAKGGATVAQLAGQASQLPPVDLVIVNFGANDICGEPAGQHVAAGPYQGVAPAEFESLLRAGVKDLQTRGATVYLLSVPDLRAAWENAPVGTSTDPAAQAPFFAAIKTSCLHGQDVDSKVNEYNGIIKRIATETGSLSDDGAMHALRLTPDMISTVDGLHPNAKGTQAIANAAWDAYQKAVAAKAAPSH
jgi:lysophospholipase L1-like esterase